MSVLDELSPERFLEEWRKLLSSPHPSKGLRFALEVGILSAKWPIFSLLVGVPQDPVYHEEVDVFEHTCIAVDYAAEHGYGFSIMLAVLLHDVGKPATTKMINGRWTSRDHAIVGAELARSFLQSINADVATTEKVIKLIEHHMWLWISYPNAKKGAFRKLARVLYPATIEELAMVASADGMGKREEEVRWLLRNAVESSVLKDRPKNVILGRDLIDLGYSPSPQFGRVIEYANMLHEDYGLSRTDILDVFSQLPSMNKMILWLPGI